MGDKFQERRFANFRVNITDARYKKILRYVRGMRPGKVLEIGCASGDFLYVLKRGGWDTAGIEITPSLAAKARQKGIRVVNADAQEFSTGVKYDLIIAGEVIEHITDTRKFLRSCHGALKDGGAIIITTPNLLFWVNRIVMLFGKEPYFAYADFHYHMFVLRDIRKQISEFFHVERVLGSHMLVSTRRHRMFWPFELLADYLPSLSAHLIFICRKGRGRR